MSLPLPVDASSATSQLGLASVGTSGREGGGFGEKEIKEWEPWTVTEIGRSLKTDDLNGRGSWSHVTLNYWQPKSFCPAPRDVDEL